MLSLHDALPIWRTDASWGVRPCSTRFAIPFVSARRGSIQCECRGHVIRQLADTALDIRARGVDRQLRFERRLVGRGNPGEVGDLAGAGPPVETLRVARLAGREIGLDEDLVEAVAGEIGRAHV